MCLASSLPPSPLYSALIFSNSSILQALLDTKARIFLCDLHFGCSTLSLSPTSMCFMQNNWFRELFIHMLPTSPAHSIAKPASVQSQTFRGCWLGSAGVDNTSACFRGGAPSVMEEAKDGWLPGHSANEAELLRKASAKSTSVLLLARCGTFLLMALHR